ncbi:MaoC family dehydratase N-terminal domain-containing protein [Georgenia sp. TF02-10]|uniref:FAS1-like dehydratase domain-containing protein n=1 Tax=Georgenia sp. TF02-10 TaxID=2917725 RepID=UPI001FA70B55|nr:MaoC family dehydratase N-terminal domain-containing protein [Georgenia sp. TF02-10]UNX54392.1 MaoC family dehydratase N-terminal domain-containing protein [Georgenia sp. TF02-10]
MPEPSPRPTGVDPTLVGRSYAPTETYEVSRAKIAELAAATGADHPAHTDPDAAWALGHGDVVAPPTFAVVLAQRAEQAYVASPESGIDFARVVHAEERLTHHRPIVAGDRLRTTVHVDKILRRGALTLVTTRAEIADEADAPVSTVVSTLAVREGDMPEADG